MTTLDAANGPWLGVSPSRNIEATVPFPVGTRLVMYTDGLVERRDRTFDVGIAEMIASVSSTSPPDEPGKLIDLIVDNLIADRGHGDDIAVLAVCNRGSKSSSPQPGIDTAELNKID